MGLFVDGFKELKKASEPLYKTPKSIQETIEIMAVAENGIFEVARNKFSKCYRFQDINYTTATEDEQIGIFTAIISVLRFSKGCVTAEVPVDAAKQVVVIWDIIIPTPHKAGTAFFLIFPKNPFTLLPPLVVFSVATATFSLFIIKNLLFIC